MRNFVIAFLVMLGLPVAALAQGQPVSLYNAQTGWAVASNAVFASNGLPLAYNPAYDSRTSTSANYIVSIYGSSESFGPLTYSPGATESWTETTAPLAWTTANISFSSGSYSENVVENGAGLACLRNNAPAEYDMYLSPDSYDYGTNVVSAINTAYRANPALVPSLTQCGSLAVSGLVTINNWSPPTEPSPCSLNDTSVGIYFALVDRKTNQQMSYELHLGSLCYPGTDYVSCTHKPNNAPVWYKSGILWCVTDTPVGLTSGISIVPKGGTPINLPLTSPGTVTFNAMDFLPRLEAMVEANPYNLDKNLSDWQFSGLSYGTVLWGDAVVNTTWSGLSLAATCKNTNCV